MLITKKLQILAKNLDFSNVFLRKKALMLLEATNLKQHTIELQKSQQSIYMPIYSFGLLKLETLKMYIQTNFANGFICLSKSFSSTFILLIQKLNGSLKLCINYWGLNNFIIKNQYFLPFINKL